MKNKILILIIALITISTKCYKNRVDCHQIIYVNNNSNNTIYFYRGNYYPDTSIKNFNPVLSGNTYKVDEQSVTKNYSRGCYEDDFQYSHNKLIYFIFDANTLETTPWDTVRAKYLILKRYEFTLEDFQNNNFTITYP